MNTVNTVVVTLLAKLKQHQALGTSFQTAINRITVRDLCQALDSSPTSHAQIVLCNILRKKQDMYAGKTLLRVLRRTKNAKVRAAAAEALGDLNIKRAGPELLRLLRSQKKQPVYVRDTAILALGLLRYQPAERTLIKEVASPHRTIRYCSAKALGLLKSRKAIPTLIQRQSRERNPQIKKVLTRAMQDIAQ